MPLNRDGNRDGEGRGKEEIDIFVLILVKDITFCLYYKITKILYLFSMKKNFLSILSLPPQEKILSLYLQNFFS